MRADEQEAYRLHARLPVFRRRVDRAVDLVRRALGEQPGQWAVSVSGGKDSVALAALAVEAGWTGSLFHFWADEVPIENTMLVMDLGARLDRPMITARIEGDWALWRRAGRVIAAAETDEDRRILAQHERAYKAQIAAAMAAAGIDGVFLGLRAEESRARRMTIARKGRLYQTESRAGWTALPLADWTGRDVWAYLLDRGLPWLPIYDRAEDRERGRSEITYTHGAGGDAAWGKGMGRWLRETDPALWARVCAEFPALRAYG